MANCCAACQAYTGQNTYWGPGGYVSQSGIASAAACCDSCTAAGLSTCQRWSWCTTCNPSKSLDVHHSKVYLQGTEIKSNDVTQPLALLHTNGDLMTYCCYAGHLRGNPAQQHSIATRLLHAATAAYAWVTGASALQTSKLPCPPHLQSKALATCNLLLCVRCSWLLLSQHCCEWAVHRSLPPDVWDPRRNCVAFWAVPGTFETACWHQGFACTCLLSVATSD